MEFSVDAWLTELGMEEHAPKFTEQGLGTQTSLRLLSHEQLQQIGITMMGHRNTILHAITLLLEGTHIVTFSISVKHATACVRGAHTPSCLLPRPQGTKCGAATRRPFHESCGCDADLQAKPAHFVKSISRRPLGSQAFAEKCFWGRKGIVSKADSKQIKPQGLLSRRTRGHGDVW